MARPPTTYFIFTRYKESAPRQQTAVLKQRLLTTLTMFRIKSLRADAKETTLREWRVIANEIGLEAFNRILDEHIRESQFFPTVADLRERAGIRNLERDSIETNQAWEFACRFVQKHWHPAFGCYDNAPPISPRIGIALRQIGGWEALYNCAPELLHCVCRDFAKAYRDAASPAVKG